VSLHEQTKRDLRWIREPFLSDTGEHEFLIVHGHTVVDVVEERANRICIDTGAVYSGKLTALVVEDDKRRYLVTEGRPWRRTDRA
jgi:serine/threonine protein phosphatase 1